jgi:hypothetical protein
MTADEVTALQKDNAKELARMNIDAAGMIQSLLLDLGSNSTYIRLQGAQSHSVLYAVVEGTAAFVQEIGDELGLSVTPSMLEVPHRQAPHA